MICGLLVGILGHSASVNATRTPIGPFNGLWSESFDSMPGGQTHQTSIMGGNATISIASDWLLPGTELIPEPHFNMVLLDFVTPVDAFGAYMRVDDSIEYRRNINVRFFDSRWNDVGDVFIRTPGCLSLSDVRLLYCGMVKDRPSPSNQSNLAHRSPLAHNG